jgi:two-component system, NarL family, nitrate/nitrite response regulator NarL
LQATLTTCRSPILLFGVERLKLLIVDDHPVVREGLAAVLAQLGPDTVVLQVGDAVQAFALVADQEDLDIVILDIAMPGMDGLQALAELGRLRPALPVVVISASEDARDVRLALAKGALGYVPKSAGPHTLVAAVQLVLQGDIYVPPLILADTGTGNLPEPKTEARSGRQTLTERQIEVLKRLSDGQPNKRIALDLSLSEKTVKAHVTAIFRALNAVNRTQAAAIGRETGLI